MLIHCWYRIRKGTYWKHLAAHHGLADQETPASAQLTEEESVWEDTELGSGDSEFEEEIEHLDTQRARD